MLKRYLCLIAYNYRVFTVIGSYYANRSNYDPQYGINRKTKQKAYIEDRKKRKSY